jgi:predicted PurR-regulated permease PerM
MTLYVFYVEGERIVETARRLSAVLFPTAPAEFMEHIGAAIRGVVFGLLGTALVQGILAGSAFALVGIPSPVALGAATAALALVPAGPSLLGLGAVVWLLAHDRLGAAIGIGLWMLLVVASVDNVLRPLLISGPARISFLLVFFGVLGGLAWLGLLGIFVGPVLLSVAFALLVEFSWRHSPQPRSP